MFCFDGLKFVTCVWFAGQNKFKPEVGYRLCNAMYKLARGK